MVAAWYLRTQATDRADILLREAAEHTWIAPHCFGYEVRNLLLKGERKHQIERFGAGRIWNDLKVTLQVEILTAPFEQDIEIGLDLARAYRLSLFDGLYLLTAAERGVALAARDDGLLAAARSVGVQVYDAGPT